MPGRERLGGAGVEEHGTGPGEVERLVDGEPAGCLVVVEELPLALVGVGGEREVEGGDALALGHGLQPLSYVELHAARLMVYQAAWKNDQKKDIRNEAYMAKLFADEMSFRVVDRVLQIHGGIGLTLDLPLAKWFVDQRSRMITEGASEVMRMVIAREVLKKYN